MHTIFHRAGWLYWLAGAGIGLALLMTLVTANPIPPSQAAPVLSVDGIATDIYPGEDTTYRIDLLNHSDEIVYDGVISITLPISFTYVPSSTVVMGEGWPLESREPTIAGQTLTWGPYNLPAAGNKAHNPYGIHIIMHDCAELPLHLEGAKTLVGNGGYVTQLFYGIDANTTGPDQCPVNFVTEAYARNLIPIVRVQGHSVDGVWQAPDPGPNGDYSEVAQGFANFVAGLPRRDTNPLYIAVWNEPNLWIEWSGSPNAAQYGAFFVAVSNAVRQLGDARIRLINGAMTPSADSADFLEGMLNVPGFRDAFDAWASHCYPYNHPDWYNIHSGTAQHGTYAIDCYLEELAIINSYGRTGVKVMLTETGYNLGNNTFGFEGFASINESNRAEYIAGAFADYWQNWPEIVAVTPFELADTSGHWDIFDWIYPTPPYPTHPQYDSVAALPKPDGGLAPYGYQVIFKAKADPLLAPGVYSSQLSGRERTGSTATAADAAPVQVYETGSLTRIYLPLMLTSPPQDGPWYLSEPPAPSPGAIVPSHFLQPDAPSAAAQAAPVESLPISLAGEPRAIALAEDAGLGAVILADGRLEIIDLTAGQSKGAIFVGDRLQAVAINALDPTHAYVSLEGGLARVDMQAGQVATRWPEPGRWRGLAHDAATRRLFAVDAGQPRLLVLRDDLSQPMAKLSLDHQPDHLIFDPAARRLYIAFPAVPEVIAIDADSLAVTARASLSGGPLLDLALDPARNRLYALSALAPRYRGLTVWETPTLQQIALVAGASEFPLQTAASLAVLPTGHLLLPETTGLWQITPRNFAAGSLLPLDAFPPGGRVAVNRSSGSIYILDPAARQLRVFQ